MIGKPKYRKGEKVQFFFNGKEEKYGEIDIIDAFGTWGQSEEVSYDIRIEIENCLYKHVVESDVRPIQQEITADEIKPPDFEIKM